MLIGGGYFFFCKKSLFRASGAGLVIALGLVPGWFGLTHEGLRSKRTIELYRKNSNFGLLQVIQEAHGPLRYYLNDYLTQNTYLEVYWFIDWGNTAGAGEMREESCTRNKRVVTSW